MDEGVFLLAMTPREMHCFPSSLRLSLIPSHSLAYQQQVPVRLRLRLLPYEACLLLSHFGDIATSRRHGLFVDKACHCLYQRVD